MIESTLFKDGARDATLIKDGEASFRNYELIIGQADDTYPLNEFIESLNPALIIREPDFNHLYHRLISLS